MRTLLVDLSVFLIAFAASVATLPHPESCDAPELEASAAVAQVAQ